MAEKQTQEDNSKGAGIKSRFAIIKYEFHLTISFQKVWR